MSIADAAKSFALKRKEFLRARSAGFRSDETNRLYVEQDRAWEKLGDMLRDEAMGDPDGALIRALENVS